MKIKQLILATVLTVGGLIPTLTQVQAQQPILQPGSNCVAYRTHKTLAMVSNQDVVGVNCGITVKAVKEGDKLAAEVLIPISAFDSKERDRDKEVAKLLKASQQPVMVFRSQALSAEDWKAMLQRGNGSIRGKLTIGNKPFPVSSQFTLIKRGTKIEAYGRIMTKFTAFGIQPPEVGPGGMIAKAPDYLELHFNLSSDKLQNKAVVPGL